MKAFEFCFSLAKNFLHEHRSHVVIYHDTQSQTGNSGLMLHCATCNKTRLIYIINTRKFNRYAISEALTNGR